MGIQPAQQDDYTFTVAEDAIKDKVERSIKFRAHKVPKQTVRNGNKFFQRTDGLRPLQPRQRAQYGVDAQLKHVRTLSAADDLDCEFD